MTNSAHRRNVLRALEWDGCLNARDVGGYAAVDGVTRYGVLLRSDTLGRLTERGRNIFAESGVRTIVDLRSADELTDDPNPFATSGSVRYLNLPLHNEDDREAIARIASYVPLREMYEVMLRHFGANVATVAEAVATSDGAVVLHCYAGKDRTGLVVALLLAAVGVGDKDVIADYVASHDCLREPRAARISAAVPEERALLEHRLGAEAATMSYVLNVLKAEYGGAEGYLQASGVADASLQALKQRLVEPV